jgi:hypothetical protein
MKETLVHSVHHLNSLSQQQANQSPLRSGSPVMPFSPSCFTYTVYSG